MNNFSQTQNNDNKKPFNFFNSTPHASSISQAQFKNPTFNDDSTAERTTHCPSCSHTSCCGPAREPPQKKFKPNTNGSRSRISFDGAEECFKIDSACPRRHQPLQHLPANDSTFAPHDSRSSSISSCGTEGTNTANPGTRKQSEEGQAPGQGTEEEAEEDGNKPPYGGIFAACDCSKFVLDDSCLATKDRTPSGSTLTSPTLSSTAPTGINLSRDLSLGREDDSSDSPAEECPVSSKIRAKLATKAARKSSSADSKTSEETEGERVLQKFKRAASEQGFECLSTKCPSPDCPLTYQCSQKHTVTTKEFARTGTLSCPKCQKRLNRCVEYAKAHNGKVINKTYNEYIEYECDKGHIWKIKYSEQQAHATISSMFTTWCSHCSKQKKEEERKKRKEEDKRQKEKDVQEQERIFEEARKRMLEEEQHQYCDYNYLFQNWPSYYYVYSASNNGMNDESINQLANEKARKHLAENPGDVNLEDLFFLYKVLLTSKEMLITKLYPIP